MEQEKKHIDLFVFYTNTPQTMKYIADGADGVVIDWESKEKQIRQALFDTQINMHSLDDLSEMRLLTDTKIICRVNRFAELEANEIEDAVAKGANEILLPMVESPAEVEQVLKRINGKCQLGIMLETDLAVKNAGDYTGLPISRVFVGLNDLAIDRGYDCIFEPVFNGSIMDIRHHFPMDFGFGGLTRPSLGNPVPCRIILNEIKKHDCSFTFLRRSFFKDSLEVDSSIIIQEIREEFSKPVYEYDAAFNYRQFLTTP
jgi:hypothetical protein